MKYKNYPKNKIKNKKHIRVTTPKIIKTSRYIKGKHIGEQPIRVLFDGIMPFFVNMSPDFSEKLKKAIDSGDFNNEIVIDRDLKFETLVYINSKKQIHLSETFLSYLWCFCYCLIIFLKYFTPLPKDIEIEENVKRKYKEDCTKLLIYAKSLIEKGHSLWDIKNLPNPEYYNTEENPYIEPANMVYIIAVNFILAHEFGHAILGHFNEEIPPKTRLEKELEADDFAFKAIMGYSYSEVGIEILKYGCISGLCSLIFLNPKLRDKKGEYPDSDDRVKIVIEKNKTPDDDLIWKSAATTLALWAYSNKIKIENLPFHNSKELFENLANQLK